MVSSICPAKIKINIIHEIETGPHEPENNFRERINNQDWFICKNCGCLVLAEAE